MTTPDPNHPQYQQPQHQQQYQPGPPSKKKWYKRAIIMIPLTLIVLFVLFMGGCMALLGGAANEVDKEMNKEYAVTYAVTGDATDATATYTVENTNTTQDTGIAAGWTKDVTIKGFSIATLSVSNGMNDTGAITCQILVDGEVVNENTASGQFASASCSVNSSDLDSEE